LEEEQLTQKTMTHSHISREDRFKIQSWLETEMEYSEISERLKKNRSTVSCEIRRNSNSDGSYTAGKADKRARKRRLQGKRRSKKLLLNPSLRKSILYHLKKKKSPEQIAGRKKTKGKEYVCHETIYQFIYTEQEEWKQYLRQKKRKYRRRHGTKQREKEREQAKKRWITERPEYINNRSELGHWEGDTVRGKQKTGSIATYAEKVSGYGKGIKIRTLEAMPLRSVSVAMFKKIPKYKRRSMTLDNGKEFSEYEGTERDLDMTHYFALPYHAWERGTNENWNGLLRQYFPKGSDFSNITQDDVDRAVNELNHRPRKRLNYLTPYEVFIKGLKP